MSLVHIPNDCSTRIYSVCVVYSCMCHLLRVSISQEPMEVDPTLPIHLASFQGNKHDMLFGLKQLDVYKIYKNKLEQIESNHMKSTSANCQCLIYGIHNTILLFDLTWSTLWWIPSYSQLETPTCAVSKNKLMFRCVERRQYSNKSVLWTLMSLPPKHSDKNNPATLQFCGPVWGWWNLAVIFGPTGWTMVAWLELWYMF